MSFTLSSRIEKRWETFCYEPILMILGSFCMVSDMPESLKISPSPSKVNFKVISTSLIYFSSFNALNKVLVF